MKPQTQALLQTLAERHAELCALVQANLDASLEENAEAMAERHADLELVMRALGETTQTLVAAVQDDPLPDELRRVIDTWREDLMKLLQAVQVRQGDIADRRALVAETLGRLRRAGDGFAGYKQSSAQAPRFIQREA